MKTIEERNAEFQQKLLGRILETLAGMGCVYAIKTSDGQTHGDLDAVCGKKPRKPRAPAAFPSGEIKNYVAGHLVGIKPGTVVLIPADKYGVERVQTSACNHMSEHYGKGLYRSSQQRDENSVLIEFHNGLGG